MLSLGLFAFHGTSNHPATAKAPMGWNSWDSYGTTITEDEVLANARFMAEHLKATA